MSKKHYVPHEEGYKKFREKGRFGWYTKERQTEMLEDLAELLKKDYVPKRGRLLEMGCGDGEKSLFMASRGFEVTGVDLSPTAVEWAKDKANERGIKAEFFVDDVLHLTTQKDETFDFVLDGDCLHCIVGEGRRMFLDSAWRVLKPGGFLRVQTMTQSIRELEKNIQPPLSYDPRSRIISFNGEPYRFVGYPDEIREEVQKAGFKEFAYTLTQGVPGKEDQFTDGIKLDAGKVSREHLSGVRMQD